MTFCAESSLVDRLLQARESDEISPSDERSLRSHLGICSLCANRAVRFDPSLFFLSLGVSVDDSSPRAASHPSSLEEESRKVAADVMAVIELEQARRRFGPPRRRAVLKAASFVLLAGALLSVLATRGPLPVAQKFSSAGAPTASPLSDASNSSSSRTPELNAAGGSERSFHRPLIEGLQNPGATVYQFASDSPKEPNVVFVVDRNADL